MTDKLDNVTKALALARLGIKVFPVDHKTRAPKISEKKGGRGFYDATIDFETIATWFTELPENTTEVAVWAGGSDLLAVDIDKGKKNGKDGFASLDEAGLSVSETETYKTSSGGEHHIYASQDESLTLDADVTVKGKKLEGVDVRAGGSYFVWWGNTVPESRDAFSTDIPAWVIEAASPKEDAEFTGDGFSGSVDEWLGTIPDDTLPSGRIRELLNRIPKTDFGHPQMVELAWNIVRMGSERETGVKTALETLRSEWLRAPYDTPANRRDFDLAVRGGINKGGRVQNPVPAMTSLSTAMKKAVELGIADQLKAIEREVSETDSEIELARARKAMFKLLAEGGMTPASTLGIVTGSKSFKGSKVSVESAWFSDGEPHFADMIKALVAAAEEDEAKEQQLIDAEVEAVKGLGRIAADAAMFTFLAPSEKKIAEDLDWFGRDYLRYVESKLKHYNKPYHVGALFAALSTIASPWGKVPLPGANLTDCNLNVTVLGESTSGKTEAWDFGTALIDCVYGMDEGPIRGDIQKLSALALHRALVLNDGKPSLVYGDEIQSFFQGVTTTQWQNGILGDLSGYYGGNVSPKLTLNDKEISGKRARTMLSAYLTGIATQTLDAISLNQWTNGFFHRFLWNFGEPRKPNDFDIKFETGLSSYKAQYDLWGRELKKRGELQKLKWGEGRAVEWDEDARLRMGAFTKQIDEATKASPVYDEVFVAANLRFAVSIMKVATIIALIEASEKVKMEHLLVALNFAGPWHRGMVIAVSETAKEPFDREVEKCLIWIKRNAIRQIGKPAWVQRSAVMRAFKPNEIAERLLRQLTEEGWLVRSGDTYELTEGE